jgi:cell division protein FtsB
MKFFNEARSRAHHVIGPILGAALIVYITYHALQGERGLIAYWQLVNQVEQAKIVRADMRLAQKRIANRVALLSNASIDRDMLDERARYMLGYSLPGEIIILLGAGARL